MERCTVPLTKGAQVHMGIPMDVFQQTFATKQKITFFISFQEKLDKWKHGEKGDTKDGSKLLRI
jgi:hypothetical protein